MVCTTIINCNCLVSRLSDSDSIRINRSISSCREGCTRSTNCSTSLVKSTCSVSRISCNSSCKFITIICSECRGVALTSCCIFNCNRLMSTRRDSNCVRVNCCCGCSKCAISCECTTSRSNFTSSISFISFNSSSISCTIRNGKRTCIVFTTSSNCDQLMS